MALFTDGSVSSIEELTAQDSQLLDVATAEGIDVTAKLALAQDELAVELGELLNRLSGTEQPFWSSGAPRIASVVVTAPLKLCHTFRALEAVYRDAYNNQLNDRYAGKRDQFHEMARWAYEKVIQSGIGIAASPTPRAATADLSPAPGNLADGTYFVAIAWANCAGEEGPGSDWSSISLSGSTLLVTPGVAPENVAGWNVYIGKTPDGMVRQNLALIPAGQTWLQASELATLGRMPGLGQQPNYWRQAPRMIPRG